MPNPLSPKKYWPPSSMPWILASLLLTGVLTLNVYSGSFAVGRMSYFVANAEQVDLLHRVADEVRDILLEGTQRHVARVREVVLQRNIEVVGLERQEGRIVLVGVRQEPVDGRTTGGTRVLSRCQAAVPRTSNGLAVREAGLQGISQTHVEVQVGQNVVVAAITRDYRRSGGAIDL